MKKILIVGKNSYIGNHLESYLEGFNQADQVEYEVVKVSASNGEWKAVDYADYDIVVLLSGLVHKKESVYGYEAYYKVNYEMAVEIARKAKESNVSQFIFTSTMAVFGDHATRITQETKEQPTTFYGKTKLMAEQTILEMEDDAFKVSVVRPPMVYGKGCKGNFPRLASLVKKLLLFPRVQNKRSMIHIDNLCEFLHLLIETKKTGVFHPQNKELVSTCELVSEISKQQNKKLYLVPGFSWVIKLGMKYVRSMHKVFGDCYYEQEMSQYVGMDYWIIDEIESVKKSV
ncbi:UDP-glucose 4-epimerase [Lachnospiraceae bacterium KM106-2]|nr:UDP-glucose 4-epimerase [Lachnospiraceae bacterium KM106-2]